MWDLFKAFFEAVFIAILISILFVSLSQEQLIESAPGQSVAGAIVLSGTSSVEGLAVSAQINMAGLSPSEPPIRQQGSITVKFPGQSQRHWIIKARADDTTEGHMTEFDISNNNYVENGKQLNTPIFVWIDEDNIADLSQSETALKSGRGSGTFPVYFEQAAVWGDAALPLGREYRMTITFTLI